MPQEMKMPTRLWWKCTLCGYVLREKEPPEVCPSCSEKCAFTDVTCYTPDCGGPENPDPKLL